MNEPAERRQPRSRRQAWILAGVFFAPLLLAFALYYGGSGWRPPGNTNIGELIQPPRPLPAVDLLTPSGNKLEAGAWRGRWSLVYVGDGRCDARCGEALILMRQTRLALNADRRRVQRIFLASGNCCDHARLTTEHAGLLIATVDDSAGATLLEAFPDPATVRRAGRIYIVDPLGNLLMRYAPGTPPQGPLADLRKLLKLSRIG